MAKKVSTAVTDDLDGSTGAEAVKFSFGGLAYEIDLAPVNRERLQKSLQPFMDAARRSGMKRPARRAADRRDTAAIRAWAAAQGMEVAARGRMSAEVVSKYKAAH